MMVLLLLPLGGSLRVCGSPHPGMMLMYTRADMLQCMFRMHCAQSIIMLQTHIAHNLRCSTKLQYYIKHQYMLFMLRQRLTYIPLIAHSMVDMMLIVECDQRLGDLKVTCLDHVIHFETIIPN
jgi:hypothetical protein